MTIIDLITQGRQMEKRARQIRLVREYTGCTEQEAIDHVDAEAEQADDERREMARLDAAEERKEDRHE